MTNTTSSWLRALPSVATDVLRDYQMAMTTNAADALDAGHRRLLMQAPTGAGKTHVIATVAAAAAASGRSVLVLATRNRIVRQLHQRLDAFNVPHGVLAAPFPELRDTTARVQIAGVDTLYRRAVVGTRTPMPPANVVIFDEAHLALGDTRVAVLEQYNGAMHFGFTATPATTAGRSLRDRFDKLILGPSVADLIERGVLVRPRIFSVPSVSRAELDAVTKDSKTGDYAVGELAAVMAQPKLVGDVLQNWLRIANGTRTLIFACSKAHAAALVADFLGAGVTAELLTDADPEADREAAIARLESGETRVLVNCFLLSYGIDIPNVETIVLARPTRSVALYLQAVGRGLRSAIEKMHCNVIDHGRVVESLGMPHTEFYWTLDDATNMNRAAREHSTAAGERPYETPRTCPECHHHWLVSEEGPVCTACGWMPAPRARPIAALDVELHELEGRTDEVTQADIDSFFTEAIGFYARKKPDAWAATPNKARAFAWFKTVERFELNRESRMPSRCWRAMPTTPSPATYGWLQAKWIAYAKSRRAAA